MPLLTMFTLANTVIPHVSAEEPGRDHIVGTMSEELKAFYGSFSAAADRFREARDLLWAENLRWRQRQIYGIKIRQHEREAHESSMLSLESRFKAARAAFMPLHEQFKAAAEAEFPLMSTVANSGWFVQGDQIGWNDRPVTYIFGF